jgi:structure-specific recognition protein 1
MLASSMQMQGVQYSYRIKYEDIQSLFLLPKPDGSRMAFVISLEKPIRQGNQKYQHLIIETHKIENTITVNLTEEELKEKYDGQLTKEMTAPLSTLFAKIFKVLSQTTVTILLSDLLTYLLIRYEIKVFVPKHFISSRESNAIKCSLKANDGLLYPLAKSFIFIHKPTVIIKFEDVESIEFQRYDPTVISGNYKILSIN